MNIPTRVIRGIPLQAQSAQATTRAFRSLFDGGATLVAGGRALDRPSSLVRGSCVPRHELDAEPFGLRIFLSNVHQNPDLRFVVAYVLPRAARRPRVVARIFYKDTSLMWRAASHLVKTPDEFWIGKGAVTAVRIDGEVHECSLESTTDLPLELQAAIEAAARSAESIPATDRIIERVLRRGPAGRIAPYADFSGPRQKAASNRRNLVNGGRPVASFARANDPESLRFVKGFEPDFSGGVVDVADFESGYYGGRVRFFRVLSSNGRIQYGFMAAPEQVWIIPPQALTMELSTFALRTIDVAIDENVCVPGYEFHYTEQTEDGVEWHSQIPPGFAGAHHPKDEDRADASAWIDRLPVVREFRRKVLRRGGGR